MKPPPFDYVRAARIEEALAVLAEVGDEARILAGGQSLVAMLNMRLAQPAVLVDIMHLPEAHVRVEKGRLVIPANARQAGLMERPTLADEVPLLTRILPSVGHPQTRARGTICGSIAHADPSAELPLALAILDGEVHLRSARRARRVKAADFFQGMMMTDKTEIEMVEAVSLPLTPEGTGTAFAELGRRKGDFAIVACAAIAYGPRLRLAVGGVNDVPLVQDWEGLAPADLDDALNTLAWRLDAREDAHASATLRRHLVRTLGRRTIDKARKCAA